MPIDGMMNCEKYTDTLTKKVTPEMARRFPGGLRVFQQDIVLCYASRKVKSVAALHKISALDYLKNSFDLNLIENRWRTKLQLRKKDCTTTIKLIEAIIECWNCGPQIQDSCKKLIVSMTK